ncbi:hypothetical protein ACQP3J_32125 [Escherichia coli]
MQQVREENKSMQFHYCYYFHFSDKETKAQKGSQSHKLVVPVNTQTQINSLSLIHYVRNASTNGGK